MRTPPLGESRPTGSPHTAAEPPPKVSPSEEDDGWVYSEEKVTALHIGPCPDCARLRETVTALTEALAPFVTRGTGPNQPPRAPSWKNGGQHVMWLEPGEWEAASDLLARLRSPQTDVSGR
jgi:hypothetical protein